MKIDKYHVHLTFTTEILGSQPTIDVATEFIAGKNDIELPSDEAMALPEALERGTTVFHKVDGQPVLWDYQIRGFLKAAAKVLNGKVTGGVKNLRSKVENTVFVVPRTIPLLVPEGYVMRYNERPLRAQTAQGDRVALARSEMLPIDTQLDFNLEVLPGEISENVLIDLFDYGRYCGLGQWRNGSWGQFSYTLTKQ